jgi:hypothetical protein
MTDIFRFGRLCDAAIVFIPVTAISSSAWIITGSILNACQHAFGASYGQRRGSLPRLHLSRVSSMPLFTYRCPKTGQLGHAFSAEDLSENTNTTSSSVVPCASKSIASIQLLAQSWADSGP